MLQIKRAYEARAKSDGIRVLVDRLWPRGIKKENLAIDYWLKEVAPSQKLRKAFGHDLRRWKEFVTQYKKELKSSPEAAEKIRWLSSLAKRRNLTLLYGARDEEHNQAVVLKEVIEKSSCGNSRRRPFPSIKY